MKLRSFLHALRTAEEITVTIGLIGNKIKGTTDALLNWLSDSVLDAYVAKIWLNDFNINVQVFGKEEMRKML